MGVLLWLWVVAILVTMLAVYKLNQCDKLSDLNKYWGPTGSYDVEFKRDFNLALCLLVTVFISALLYKQFGYKAPALPDSFLKEHWGSRHEDVGDTSIRPFKVVFEDSMILNLKSHLAKHNPSKKTSEALDNYLNTLVSFWIDKYDFKARENFLNKYLQYITNIQGLDIHFLHVKPEEINRPERVLPLILVPGWTSSVHEFYDFILLLTTPRAGAEFVFEVIVPSLPGCGFSEVPTKSGLDELEASIILRNLMKRLGYDKFIVQGTGHGSAVGAYLATLFPDEVLGYYSNKPVVHAPVFQRKMPSVNVNKNPVALATYILENFSDWSSCKHVEFTDRCNLERLVDNLMIHWISNNTWSSARLHADKLKMNRKRDLKMSQISTKAPAAFICFQNDTSAISPSELRVKYRNVVHYTNLKNSGHFTTSKSLQLLADDFWKATKKFL